MAGSKRDATFEEKWLHDFVLPLVAGGDVRVAGVLGQRELKRLILHPLDREESGLRVSEARQAVMAEILIDPAPPELDEEAVRLAVAMQAVLFLSHPEAQGSTVRKSRLKELGRWAADVATLPAPEAVYALAARHSMLHHLFDLGRDDVRVSFWVGRREFRGTEPPARLLKWPDLRRVREERWRTGLLTEAAGDPGQRAIVLALLASSPLTDLLEPVRMEPPLDLSQVARHLREPVVARAVADRWLGLGVSQIAAPVAASVIGLAGRKGHAGALKTALQFVSHLHLLSVLGRREPRFEANAWLPELNAVTQGGQLGPKDFFAIYAAAHEAGLGRPQDLARDHVLRRAVDAYAAACAQLAGEVRVTELTQLFLRGLGATRAALPAATPN
jgi:hypothetical protein